MTPSQESDTMVRRRLPDGREAVFALQRPGLKISERIAQSVGRLEWMLPDKSMVEAVTVRLPDWPPDVYAWRIVQKPIAAATMPCHDPGPVAHYIVGQGWRPFGMAPWECFS